MPLARILLILSPPHPQGGPGRPLSTHRRSMQVVMEGGGEKRKADDEDTPSPKKPKLQGDEPETPSKRDKSKFMPLKSPKARSKGKSKTPSKAKQALDKVRSEKKKMSADNAMLRKQLKDAGAQYVNTRAVSAHDSSRV